MIVQNDGDSIRLSNEFVWELLTREEALHLLEELTEAIRMCPVDIKANAPAGLPAVAGKVHRDVGQCEDCAGTGWYGDNGPGIVGNSEFCRCECGTGEKCTCGYHEYIEIGNVPWCQKCNREADMDICRIHSFPNAESEASQ